MQTSRTQWPGRGAHKSNPLKVFGTEARLIIRRDCDGNGRGLARRLAGTRQIGRHAHVGAEHGPGRRGASDVAAAEPLYSRQLRGKCGGRPWACPRGLIDQRFIIPKEQVETIELGRFMQQASEGQSPQPFSSM
jgi:hypothetical protein